MRSSDFARSRSSEAFALSSSRCAWESFSFISATDLFAMSSASRVALWLSCSFFSAFSKPSFSASSAVCFDFSKLCSFLSSASSASVSLSLAFVSSRAFVFASSSFCVLAWASCSFFRSLASPAALSSASRFACCVFSSDCFRSVTWVSSCWLVASSELSRDCTFFRRCSSCSACACALARSVMASSISCNMCWIRACAAAASSFVVVSSSSRRFILCLSFAISRFAASRSFVVFSRPRVVTVSFCFRSSTSL
mmetsp:Transcript_4536/g.15839  ORF Transcript_4536/g.15839 Transcript_4536/m.15839 type:complete len:253 (+) Transcript_4536:1932-2690(+)